jgi:hypothetical protein
MRSPCLCVSMCIARCQLLNAWTNLYETWNVYHGTWAHLNGVLHKNLSSVCVSVSPSITARQRLGIHVATATNTRDIRRTVGRVIFYAACVHIKGESVGIIARQQLGKHVPAAKGFVGGVISYAVCVIWKEQEILVGLFMKLSVSQAKYAERRAEHTYIHTYIHYITFHGSKVSQMTVGCGISHTITKTHVQYNWSILYVHTHL